MDEQVAHLRMYGTKFKIWCENPARTLVIRVIALEIGVTVPIQCRLGGQSPFHTLSTRMAVHRPYESVSKYLLRESTVVSQTIHNFERDTWNCSRST